MSVSKPPDAAAGTGTGGSRRGNESIPKPHSTIPRVPRLNSRQLVRSPSKLHSPPETRHPFCQFFIRLQQLSLRSSRLSTFAVVTIASITRTEELDARKELQLPRVNRTGRRRRRRRAAWTISFRECWSTRTNAAYAPGDN